MLQQHPHHRGLGHEGPHPGQDGPVARVPEHGAVEAGAVVVVDGQNALLKLRLGLGSGVDRQIAALGVACQINGSRVDPGEGLEIPERLLLSGDLGLEAHVEVFLPAGDGQVGAPVGDDRRAPGQEPGHGGKLALKLGQELTAVEAQLQLRKPGRPGAGGEKGPVLLHPVPVLPVGQSREGLRRHLQGHGMQKIPGHQTRKINVAQFG